VVWAAGLESRSGGHVRIEVQQLARYISIALSEKCMKPGGMESAMGYEANGEEMSNLGNGLRSSTARRIPQIPQMLGA
jgi:hypothetical protein